MQTCGKCKNETTFAGVIYEYNIHVQTAYKYIYVVYLLLYDRVIFAIYLHRLVCILGLL